MSKPSDLVQGTLDMLLLKILALQPMNGWADQPALETDFQRCLWASAMALFTPRCTSSNIEAGFTAQWKSSENNRRAKFYSLTRLGRKHLEKETANWNRVSSAISGIVKLKEA